MTTNANSGLINVAKRYVREAIHETWPTAREVAETTNSMYEFDAIVIDDENCDVAEIAIMHDFDNDWYALVERPARIKAGGGLRCG